ncbi:MAG: DUF5991 domain-containing protein [Actinomycetota bacterium]|nr:DUF5991 domain-containing protein [Actinomycetota bacterium]
MTSHRDLTVTPNGTRSPGHRSVLQRVAMVALACLVVAGCGDDESDAPATSAEVSATATTATDVPAEPSTAPPSTEPATPTPTPTPAPTTTPTAAEPDAGLSPADLAGTWTWTEVATSDVGSDPIWNHELILDPADAGEPTRTATLANNGFQLDQELRVRLEPADAAAGGVAVVFVDEVEPGFPAASYDAGEVLFTLSGATDAPVTTLGALDTLLDHPATGTYFEPA